MKHSFETTVQKPWHVNIQMATHGRAWNKSKMMPGFEIHRHNYFAMGVVLSRHVKLSPRPSVFGASVFIPVTSTQRRQQVSTYIAQSWGAIAIKPPTLTYHAHPSERDLHDSLPEGDDGDAGVRPEHAHGRLPGHSCHYVRHSSVSRLSRSLTLARSSYIALCH